MNHTQIQSPTLQESPSQASPLPLARTIGSAEQTSAFSTLSALLPLFTPAHDGEWIDLGDHHARALVSSQHTNGLFSFTEVKVDFGGGVPPHIHEREDEAFYILEGCVAITVGDETFYAQPGDTAFAPRNVMHTWRCESEEGARFLGFITPGGNMEAFGMRMAQERILPSNPDSIARLFALAKEFGITMLPPQ